MLIKFDNETFLLSFFIMFEISKFDLICFGLRIFLEQQLYFKIFCLVVFSYIWLKVLWYTELRMN